MNSSFDYVKWVFAAYDSYTLLKSEYFRDTNLSISGYFWVKKQIYDNAESFQVLSPLMTQTWSPFSLEWKTSSTLKGWNWLQISVSPGLHRDISVCSRDSMQMLPLCIPTFDFIYPKLFLCEIFLVFFIFAALRKTVWMHIFHVMREKKG